MNVINSKIYNCNHDNKSIIKQKEDSIYENNNCFLNDFDDDELKGRNELMYDIIQDNYINIKNSLLILRKRLINNQGIMKPLNEAEVKNLLNIKNTNKNLIKNKIKKKTVKHSKYFFDNMFYRIKVIYHKFIISLANDIYNNCNSISKSKTFFRKISAQITQNLTKGFNKKLAELTLKEFLSKSISLRYFNISENANRGNIENIEIQYKEKEKFQPLIIFLKFTYKDLYKNFYIKDNCVELIEENFNIKRRSYTSFKESLKMLSKKENINYINKLIEVANDKFMLFLEGQKIKNRNIDNPQLNKDIMNKSQ